MTPWVRAEREAAMGWIGIHPWMPYKCDGDWFDLGRQWKENQAVAQALRAAAAGAVLWIEGRSVAPMADLKILLQPPLRSGLALNAIVATVVMATLIVGPFYSTVGLGLGVAELGAVMSVGPASGVTDHLRPTMQLTEPRFLCLASSPRPCEGVQIGTKRTFAPTPQPSRGGLLAHLHAPAPISRVFIFNVYACLFQQGNY